MSLQVLDVHFDILLAVRIHGVTRQFRERLVWIYVHPKVAEPLDTIIPVREQFTVGIDTEIMIERDGLDVKLMLEHLAREFGMRTADDQIRIVGIPSNVGWFADVVQKDFDHDANIDSSWCSMGVSISLLMLEKQMS